MLEQLFNQFVIAFREGIEASLLIMTVIIALKKRGDRELQRAAYAGIGSAIVSCAAGGYLLGSAALTQNIGHGIEATLYGAAAVTVVTMVLWMMRTGRKIKGNFEQKMNAYQERHGVWSLAGIFAFVFFMIAREGFEMMLLLIAFGKGISGGYFVASMLLGIGAAVLLAYALSRGMVKINLGKFLHSSAYVLLIFAVQLVFDVLHELGEGSFIPTIPNQTLANFIDYVHDQVPIFSYLGLALFFVLIIYHFSQGALESRNRPLERPVRA